jgi:hypothetical protein
VNGESGSGPVGSETHLADPTSNPAVPACCIVARISLTVVTSHLSSFNKALAIVVWRRRRKIASRDFVLNCHSFRGPPKSGQPGGVGATPE